MASVFYAHSFEDRSKDHWELLEDHLSAVATLSGEFAAAFDSAEIGRVAGLWHDLGKYHAGFQARLEGDPASFDHAVYGARLARADGRERSAIFRALAAIIAGHHGGLKDGPALERRCSERGLDLTEVLAAAPAGIIAMPDLALPSFLRPPPAPAPKSRNDDWMRRYELWTRFLFSALVDADSLATEEFYLGGMRHDVLGTAPRLAELKNRLASFVDAKSASARATNVQRMRLEVLAACHHKAAEAPGFFSLTVPTGGGKTFSSLAFALEHAVRHGLRRIISVIPFTSILEQTAGQYALAIGRENLIEHHSALDPEEESRRNLLACENWDAPVVVTTAVQFFESLFGNRRSTCRKLHNIARSVILLDEAQTLPVQFLSPVLDALKTLVADCGCTVLFSTATQPALAKSAEVPEGIEGIREIVPDPPSLARAFLRYRVSWPAAAEPTSWETLADEIQTRPQVLAILHQRRDARELARLLPAGEDLFHLSANLCAAHRSQVIAAVKERLRLGQSCRLISTQVVEAGVDIDFPVVYRAFAGLDSLVQSGGRCNREGLLPELGELKIFNAPSEPPPGILRRGLARMAVLLKDLGPGLDITDPEVVARYFRLLYDGEQRDGKAIQASRRDLAFETVAQGFRLIEDDWQVGVAVPWGEGATRLERLRHDGPSRRSLRALQPYLINVARYRAAAARSAGLLEEVEGVLALPEVAADLYDPVFGLDLEAREGLAPEALWV